MFKDLLLLRKKYSNSLFQKCFNYFGDKPIISEIDEKLKKNMDYDWMLQTQSTKIKLQLSTINKRIREFAKIPRHDKKIMNKLLELKKTLKEQEHSIIFLQEKHLEEITEDYLKIINFLTKSLITYADEADKYFNKMNLALTKSEKQFLFYCQHWKDEQQKYYLEINENSSLILKKGKEILNHIEIFQNDFSEYHLKTIITKSVNIAHYVENFKSEHPKVVSFKDNFLMNLNLKQRIEFLNNDAQFLNQKTLSTEELEQIKKEINETMFIFHEIYHESKRVLRKIEQEKKKFQKIAIPSKELKKKILTQWLENDYNSTFFVFSRYIEDHELKA